MINFLQFEQQDWNTFNDNQFAYHNRMRVTEFESLYKEVNHELVRWTNYNDERSRAQISNGFPLAAQFSGIDPEILTTTAIRVFSRPAR